MLKPNRHEPGPAAGSGDAILRSPTGREVRAQATRTPDMSTGSADAGNRMRCCSVSAAQRTRAARRVG
jgi:hypothetical protein